MYLFLFNECLWFQLWWKDGHGIFTEIRYLIHNLHLWPMTGPCQLMNVKLKSCSCPEATSLYLGSRSKRCQEATLRLFQKFWPPKSQMFCFLIFWIRVTSKNRWLSHKHFDFSMIFEPLLKRGPRRGGTLTVKLSWHGQGITTHYGQHCCWHESGNHFSKNLKHM